MDVRLPSVRHPRSFFDVYAVTVAGVVIMAVVLTVWHGTFVRGEMVVFMGIVFTWIAWAVYHLLDEYAERSTSDRRRRPKR